MLLDKIIHQVCFTVPIVPVAKGRPRFCRRGRFVHTFTPIKTRSFENELLLKASKFKPMAPFTGSVSVNIVFKMPIAVALDGSETANVHVSRPDLDNLLKSVLDPLNNVFWNDDAQIYEIRAQKYYSLNPGIEIEIFYWKGVGEMAKKGKGKGKGKC